MRLRNLRIGRALSRWLAFRDPRDEWLEDVLFQVRADLTTGRQ